MTSEPVTSVLISEFLLPLLIAIGTVGFGIIAYVWNAKINRRETLIEARRPIYSRYLSELMINMVSAGNPNNVAYNQSLTEVILFGSDDVVVATHDFHEHIANGVTRSNSELAAKKYAVMLTCMRKDCYEATSFSSDEVLKYLPFRYGS